MCVEHFLHITSCHLRTEIISLLPFQSGCHVFLFLVHLLWLELSIHSWVGAMKAGILVLLLVWGAHFLTLSGPSSQVIFPDHATQDSRAHLTRSPAWNFLVFCLALFSFVILSTLRYLYMFVYYLSSFTKLYTVHCCPPSAKKGAGHIGSIQ